MQIVVVLFIILYLYKRICALIIINMFNGKVVENLMENSQSHVLIIFNGYNYNKYLFYFI